MLFVLWACEQFTEPLPLATIFEHELLSPECCWIVVDAAGAVSLDLPGRNGTTM